MKRDYRDPAADEWYRQLIAHPESFPFSFCYDGVKYDGFPAQAFTLLSRDTSQDERRITTQLTLRRDDALRVRLVCAHYPLHGVSEWTVWFENDGAHESGVISDACTRLRFTGKLPMLKGILGDHANWYRPYALDLGAAPAHFESNSGRATHVNFPYFDLEYGDGGVMLAIGWAGTWCADFRYDPASDCTVYTARSVNRLHTRLRPGECIRTALFVRAPYGVRREDYATNYWRSWFIHSNLPRADAAGTPLAPFSTACLASDTGLPNSDGSISERYTTWRPSLEKMLKEDVKVDFRWVDAGWYVAPDGSSPVSDWWGTVGTWTPDPVKWPQGTFREATDFARAHGMKTLLWFEPERVCDPQALAKNFGYDLRWAIRRKGSTAISNNIGDPACFEWTVERICRMLRENGVEMYREDNNSDPGALWQYLDEQEGPERAGITECRFIEAHYRMWDTIIACTSAQGGCAFVDSCASGGGRNDLESLRRGVPMLRSDYDRTSIDIRLSMTTAFNKWVPFCGANNKEKLGQLDPRGTLDMYVWRGSYLPILNMDSQYVQDPQQDWDMLRAGLREWRSICAYLTKEFYVLTPWHTEGDNTGFTAYSYFDAESEKGILLAFRQPQCVEEQLPLTLPYVPRQAVCTLTDADSGETIRLTGEQMAAQGFTLRFACPRTARLLHVQLAGCAE